MTATSGGRLQVAASWDVPRLRGAVARLAEVAERLPSWRARVEGIARSLDGGSVWAGPAAVAAAGAVRDLSVVTWAVEGAMAESLIAFDRLALEAGRAQELARDALVLAGSVPGGLPAALADRDHLATAVGALVPGTDLTPASSAAVAAAEAALRYAAAVAVAAEDAGAALSRVGVGAASTPADFAALAARVPVSEPVCPTTGPSGPPAAVALWWAALPLPAQLAALRADPAGLGGRDGLPAWARDVANRQALRAALDDPGLDARAAATARAVTTQIEHEEAAGREVQLHVLDLAGDRVVLGLGNLDTADAVALLVPGINNSPADDLDALVGDARDVGRAAQLAAPGMTVATAVWLGYRTPARPDQILTRGSAAAGGRALADALAGLRAARSALGEPAGRATVLTHSYGTLVVDEAADRPGRLTAEAVVLLGSPGMEDDAASLEAPEVYDAVAPDDWIADLDPHGTWTGDPDYGSTELPVAPGAGHSDYYDRAGPTLAAVGEVVTGVRDPG